MTSRLITTKPTLQDMDDALDTIRRHMNAWRPGSIGAIELKEAYETFATMRDWIGDQEEHE